MNVWTYVSNNLLYTKIYLTGWETKQISAVSFSSRMRDAISRQINAQCIGKCKGNNIGENYGMGLAVL